MPIILAVGGQRESQVLGEVELHMETLFQKQKEVPKPI